MHQYVFLLNAGKLSATSLPQLWKCTYKILFCPVMFSYPKLVPVCDIAAVKYNTEALNCCRCGTGIQVTMCCNIIERELVIICSCIPNLRAPCTEHAPQPFCRL